MSSSDVRILDSKKDLLWEATLGTEPLADLSFYGVSPILEQIRPVPFSLSWFFTGEDLEGLEERLEAILNNSPFYKPNPDHWSIIDDWEGSTRYRRIGYSALNEALPTMNEQYRKEIYVFVIDQYRGYKPTLLGEKEHPYSVWDLPAGIGTDKHLDGRPITSAVKLDGNTEWNTTVVYPDPESEHVHLEPILLSYRQNVGFFWDLRRNPHHGRANPYRRIGTDINYGSAIFPSDHSVDSVGTEGAYLLITE